MIRTCSALITTCNSTYNVLHIRSSGTGTRGTRGGNKSISNAKVKALLARANMHLRYPDYRWYLQTITKNQQHIIMSLIDCSLCLVAWMLCTGVCTARYKGLYMHQAHNDGFGVISVIINSPGGCRQVGSTYTIVHGCLKLGTHVLAAATRSCIAFVDFPAAH